MTAKLLRPAFVAFALAASSLAWGEAPVHRIAYLSYVEGKLTFQAAGVRGSAALTDRPLQRGDRVATDPGGRAEISFGAVVVRLDERTELSIADLDDTTLRLELDAGVASVHLRELFEDETFELVTPNTTVTIDAPGEYRVEVASRDLTQLTVHAGAANLTTAGGPVRVADGQRVRLAGRDANASLVALAPADAFDEWVLQRELQLAAAEPPSGAPADEAGYGELDRYGDWYYDSYYGHVWSPYYTGDWKPFHDGRWQHVGHGSSWVDAAPWGFFFAYQSGHWTYLHDLQRWCWVPPPSNHGGSFAQDTRPFGRARSGARSTDGHDIRPTATTAATTHRMGSHRQSALQRDRATGGRSRGSTLVRSFGGGQQSSSGVSGSSRSGVSTMSSSGSSSRRSQSPSSSARAPKSVFAPSSGSFSPP